MRIIQTSRKFLMLSLIPHLATICVSDMNIYSLQLHSCTLTFLELLQHITLCQTTVIKITSNSLLITHFIY